MAKKLRILQAIYSLGRGGAEKLVIDVTRQLATHPDVEVLLVSFAKTVDYEYGVEGLNYKFCPANVKLSVLGANEYSLDNYIALVKEFKPDIIHSHLYMSEIITRAHIDTNIAYFTHCHDNMVQLQKSSIGTFFNKASLTNLYERTLLLKKYKSCNNHFIAISKDTFSYFNEVLPTALRKNLTLVPNAINFDQYNAINHARNTMEIRMVNTGNFSPKKNQAFLVDVMNCLKQKNVNASLTLLGAGGEMQKVKDKALQYGLADRIAFKGSVESVTEYLRDANLYVHSAYYEPFGLVLLEAMAGGLPVIALDGKGNRDLVIDRQNGFFIREQNPELFASKIIELMSDKALYQEVSKGAVEFAKGFDIKKYVDRLLKLYREAIKTKD